MNIPIALVEYLFSWEPALEYINEQYEKYLIEEQGAERTRWIHDTRVHCCLYFIPPTGHGYIITVLSLHVYVT